MSHYSLPAGTKLGDNFEIRGLLGSGGFGITYEAWDAEFHRVVAIKEYFPFDLAIRLPGSDTVTSRDDVAKEEFEKGMAQFVEEGRTLAKFADDRIVCATNFVKENGTVYMVMEYQDGRSLSKFMAEQEGPLSEEQILRIFVPLMQALEKVHRADILHRDLKPDNICIRTDGTPVLLDFGAARQKVVGKTRSLTSMLSPGYAPLEQYHTRGNQGPWTDIYALGATMYYCATGHRPEDVTARVAATNTGNPDPMPLAAEVGPQMYSETLVSTIDWMLRLNERDRPQSLTEVLDRLEGIPSQPGASVDQGSVRTQIVTPKTERKDLDKDARTRVRNTGSVDAVDSSRKNQKSIAFYSVLGLIVVLLAGTGVALWMKSDDQADIAEREQPPKEMPDKAESISPELEQAARLAEEQRKKEAAARLAEEQRQKDEAARLAEEQRKKEEAARLTEEQRQKDEAARLAEEQRKKDEAARLAEEQRKKEEEREKVSEEDKYAEEERLWRDAENADSRDVYEAYLKKCVSCSYTMAAISRIHDLQIEEAERRAEEQRKKVEAARIEAGSRSTEEEQIAAITETQPARELCPDCDYPKDRKRRNCVVIEALTSEFVPDGQGQCLTQNLGECVDVKLRFQARNICKKRMYLEWVFDDETGPRFDSVVLGKSKEIEISCLKHQQGCSGRIRYAWKKSK